ncbi:MAG: type 4a pilus biogenesis protein PilO [Firmicutes bacterium]|nr:type 4a pilus biogenesis protein PilO [Bacillota bacterium]
MNKKKTPWLTLFLVVVIFVGLLVCFMQFQDFRFAREELALEQQSLATAEARLIVVKELNKQKGQLEADMTVLAQSLPNEPLEDQLLLDLQSGADLATMDFVQIRFAERVDVDNYTEMPVQILLAGTYHEILYFLDYLQVYERSLRIDELRVDESEDKMTVNIRASAFYAAE